MTAGAAREVLGMQLSVGDHICGFYRKPSERDDILIPFLVEGLKAGDKCTCVVDSCTPDDVLASMSAHLEVGPYLSRLPARGARLLRHLPGRRRLPAGADAAVLGGQGPPEPAAGRPAARPEHRRHELGAPRRVGGQRPDGLRIRAQPDHVQLPPGQLVPLRPDPVLRGPDHGRAADAPQGAPRRHGHRQPVLPGPRRGSAAATTSSSRRSTSQRRSAASPPPWTPTSSWPPATPDPASRTAGFP